ncbi:hypothetical protein D187_002244 [Cystobacter fuscus DSM 2262]|uniref:SWIM-type domain-containing protein n=1 Tax=Cystobacter fuscus (strain ATCC 25194 / DSM 2262 / NBRC 100088 / M29) TaxID=1242864 RepID=S9QU52_CYSF2|nr:hypothetical protein [Cystobacter fuscus]EPX60158.1 hypothetical protein D187_002244 [Cystobacter fuscus DSM 2262]
MSRADLLALTPQAIASLSNLGLVKRAQKDLEEGKGPRLEELADGTVVGTFEDGVVARLVPGKAFKNGPCTCNAATVCRHRVATALAYPAFIATSAAPPPAEVKAEAPWSPGMVDDAELARVLPRRALERAEGFRKRGYLAQVRRGTFEGEDIPSVALATCTVRFLVPRDLSYARCDCSLGTGCEHLPLAIWAFRAADEKDPTRREVSVEVARGAVTTTVGGAALDTAGDLVRFLLLEGVQHASQGLAGRFAVARAGLEGARMTWPLLALEELEELLGAYVSRAARYDAPRFTAVLTEFFARMRASRTPGPVPPRAVLGMDEAPETKLDYVRLVSLGIRLFAEGRERRAEVVLADPDTAGLLVVRRAFTYAEDQTPEDGAQLGRRQGAPRTTLEALAHGQVVASGATRRTNRLILFSTQGLQRTSVTPQSGDWSLLPEPLLVKDVRALESAWRARPPRFLRPRLLAENVHAFAISRVGEVTYAPGAQEVHAELEDSRGHGFRVELSHRSVAPGALDALAGALTGGHGTPRYVSGEVRRTARGLVVEPMALSCEHGVVALDVQPTVTTGRPRTAADAPALPPLAAALTEVEGCLAEGVHQGLRHVPPAWSTRLDTVASRARGLGLKRLAEDLGALGAALARARASGAAGDEAALAETWASAALRTGVGHEQLGG